MERLLIVSNRLPVSVVKRPRSLKLQPSAGGLATGLSSFYQSHRSMWVGWPGLPADRLSADEKAEAVESLRARDCHPVFLSRADVDGYYHGFCNRAIWPLFHYFSSFAEYEKGQWQAYKKANEAFADVVTAVAEPGDRIWIHDYQLMLLPRLLRRRMADASIGFFLHIPFPSFELFRLLPWRRELLKGMLGADLIGFHTYDYVQHFLNSVRRIVGYEHTFGKISAGRRLVKADVFPMGIDYGRFARTVDSGPVKREVTRVRNRVGDKKIILSVDRLDYTKGIPRRLKMFEQFLKENPRYREQVVLILLAVPSRTAVERYKALKREVDGLVGNINGSRGTLGWNPIWYLYRSLPFTSLLALYRAADIALVTPVRDGMNLVAKEFLAAKPDETGCLVLSEMAGAAKELGEALIVNPNNQEEVIGALVQALEMGEEEQRARNVIMQKRIQRYNVVKWAIDFVYNLSDIKEDQEEYLARKLTGLSRTTLIDNYRKGERRLILLDYDGTLVRFSKQPQNVAPDGELLAVLETLSRNKKNRVVVVSGRDRQVLENWLGNLEIGLVAEHGAWIRDEGESWRTIKPMQNEWKKDLRPTLELYTDRTPGSFIEEKDFSLVWHYRQVDPEFAYVRARELKDDLLHITANMNLGVLEGNKVIEIRGQGIDKGQAGMYWIDQDWDFLMAVGDDQTDEDLFEVVPDSAYSLKVGLGSSKARFNLSSVDEVRGLIMDLARENNEKNA